MAAHFSISGPLSFGGYSPLSLSASLNSLQLTLHFSPVLAKGQVKCTKKFPKAKAKGKRERKLKTN